MKRRGRLGCAVFALPCQNDPTFKKLHLIAALNSNATFLPNQDAVPVLDRKTDGDATESGIIKFAAPYCPGQKLRDLRASSKRRATIAFNSANKWMLAVQEHPVRNGCTPSRASPSSSPLCPAAGGPSVRTYVAGIDRASFRACCVCSTRAAAAR